MPYGQGYPVPNGYGAYQQYGRVPPQYETTHYVSPMPHQPPIQHPTVANPHQPGPGVAHLNQTSPLPYQVQQQHPSQGQHSPLYYSQPSPAHYQNDRPYQFSHPQEQYLPQQQQLYHQAPYVATQSSEQALHQSTQSSTFHQNPIRQLPSISQDRHSQSRWSYSHGSPQLANQQPATQIPQTFHPHPYQTTSSDGLPRPQERHPRSQLGYAQQQAQPHLPQQRPQQPGEHQAREVPTAARVQQAPQRQQQKPSEHQAPGAPTPPLLRQVPEQQQQARETPTPTLVQQAPQRQQQQRSEHQAREAPMTPLTQRAHQRQKQVRETPTPALIQQVPQRQQSNEHQAREAPAPPLTQHKPQHRIVTHMSIPVEPTESVPIDLETARPQKRPRPNEHQSVLVHERATPQKWSISQQTKPSSGLSSLAPPTQPFQTPTTPQPAPFGYQDVLLALAEEYVDAAYSMSASVTDESTEREYHKLLAVAMGCLQSILIKYRLSDPRKETRIVLRLADLLFQETENDAELGGLLSKGIKLCEQNRLSDLKYAMHHLLIRQSFKSSPKVAFKSLDKCIEEVEVLKLVNWTYAFRLLRVSLSLQPGRQLDTAVVLKHLTAISTVAEDLRHIHVQITAAALEAMVHIRSGSTESVVLAQRAIATARTHQLGPEIQEMPQLRAFLDCLDLACSLVPSHQKQAETKMQQMQHSLEAVARAADRNSDGSFIVECGPTQNQDLELDTSAIMICTAKGNAGLTMQWMTNGQVYSLGYLLSGLASMYQNIENHKAEDYINEGLKYNDITPPVISQPLAVLLARNERQRILTIAMRLQLIFAFCGRYEWNNGRRSISDVRNEFAQNGWTVDDSTETILTYLEAVCEQGRGELDVAIQLYSSPCLDFNGNANDANTMRRDIRTLAVLNRSLVLHQLNDQESVTFGSFSSSIKAHCVGHSNMAIRAAYHTVKAIAKKADTSIMEIKHHLLHAVEAAKAAANPQMICIVMNVLTHLFFGNIVTEQAEKSGKTARSLAKTAQDRLWVAVADGMYSGTLEKMGRAAEAEALRKEADEVAQVLPDALKEILIVRDGA